MSKLGLLDKNGVEIQEGDTLLVDWKDPVSGYESKEIFKVTYREWAYHLVPEKTSVNVYSRFLSYYKDETEKLEVVNVVG